MLIDCKLENGRVIRYLIDRDWHGVLEVLFAEHGSHRITNIQDVDNSKQTWENKQCYPLSS